MEMKLNYLIAWLLYLQGYEFISVAESKQY